MNFVFHLLSALAGAILGVLALRWKHGIALALLQRRVTDAEAVAKAAVERSTQARVQVKQLSDALALQTQGRQALEAVRRRRIEAGTLCRGTTSPRRHPACHRMALPTRCRCSGEGPVGT
jgi:hypothetical protein